MKKVILTNEEWAAEEIFLTDAVEECQRLLNLVIPSHHSDWKLRQEQFKRHPAKAMVASEVELFIKDRLENYQDRLLHFRWNTVKDDQEK